MDTIEALASSAVMSPQVASQMLSLPGTVLDPGVTCLYLTMLYMLHMKISWAPLTERPRKLACDALS